MLNIVPSVEELTSPSSKIIERCSICNKLFKGNSALKTHMKRSHKEQHDQNSKYFCPVESCSHGLKNSSSPFSSFAAIKQHYKLVHGESRFSCPKCKRVFKTKHSCKQHQMECGAQYVCSCNIAYTTKRGFLEHVKRQKHKIPATLQSVFDMQAKQAKKKEAPKTQVILTSSNIILPKTLKKKIRLFRMSPAASAAFTKHVTSKNNLQSNVKNVTVRSTPQGATVVLPRTVDCENPSFATQFSHAFCIDGNLTTQLISENTQVSNSTLTENWPQKHISIQTEKSFAVNQWMNGEVNKMLLENIGTQTTESVFDKTSNETYSSFSQTDLCTEVGQDLSSLWERSYNSFSPTQQAEVCDAQNQTVTEPLHLPSADSLQDNLSDMASCDFGAAIAQSSANNTANICASIETQTDTNINFLSAQTQTNPSFNFHPDGAEPELSFDVLNDIETQTDFLLPTLPAASPSIFVHNCTQTSEPDLLSILEINN